MNKKYLISPLLLLFSLSLNAQINLMSCDTINFADSGQCYLEEAILTNIANSDINCENDSIYWKITIDNWSDQLIDYEFSSFINSSDQNPFDDSDGNGIYDIYLAPTLTGEMVEVSSIEGIEESNFVHSLVWQAYDACGNEVTCSSGFEVKDDQSPIINCDQDYVVAVSDFNFDFTLKPYEIITSIFDNCTEEDDLVYSFNLDINNTTLELDLFSDDTTVAVYVFDENGNYSGCEINIDFVQEPFPHDAYVFDANESPISNVNVEVISFSGWPQITDEHGRFIAFVSDDFDYSIQAMFNDELNGISTRDIILLKEFIDDNSGLNSPFDVIACDVDDNFIINAQDINYVTELLLKENRDTALWKFIDRAIEFEDDLFPFPYSLGIEHIAETPWQRKDLTGVKLGDIDHSAIGGQELESSIFLSANNEKLEVGDIVDVTFSFPDDIVVKGFQFSLDCDLDFVEILVGDFPLDGFAINSMSSDLLISNSGSALDNNSSKFTIRFEAKQGGELRDMIRLSEDLSPEVYLDDQLIIHALDLEFFGEVKYEDDLLSIVPNPFYESANINFELDNSSTVYFSIYDVTGRLVRELDGIEFARGKNVMTLDEGYFIGQYSGMHILKMVVDNEVEESFIMTQKFFILLTP